MPDRLNLPSVEAQLQRRSREGDLEMVCALAADLLAECKELSRLLAAELDPGRGITWRDCFIKPSDVDSVFTACPHRDCNWEHGDWDADQHLSLGAAVDAAKEHLSKRVHSADRTWTPGEPFCHPEVGLMPGYVAGECGHRVAQSEWRAGLRTCERC